MRTLQRLRPMHRILARYASAIALLIALLAAAPGAFAAAPAGPSRTFDHLTTGFELTGAHRDVQCESFQVNAVF